MSEGCSFDTFFSGEDRSFDPGDIKNKPPSSSTVIASHFSNVWRDRSVLLPGCAENEWLRSLALMSLTSRSSAMSR